MTNRSSNDLPWVLSIAIHAGLVGLALIPWSSERTARPKLNGTEVVLYTPPTNDIKTIQLTGRSRGGGGGGKHELTRASRGVLPRGADRQFAPPNPAPPKNPEPQLIVVPAIVAPQLTQLPQLTLLNLGDPNGIVSPLSSGTGDGGGIGNRGKGRGIDDGDGRALVEAKMVAVVTVPLPSAATSVRQRSSIVLNPSIPKKPGRRDIKAPSCSKPLSGETGKSI